jgi:hypothetical protein
VNATDWATVASLAAALGTLVLAVATFSAIRESPARSGDFWPTLELMPLV